MPSDRGVLFVLGEENRADRIQELIEDRQPFTDVVSSPDWTLPVVQPAVLSLNTFMTDQPTLHYAALMRREQQVANYKTKVRFSSYVDLGELPLADVIAQVRPQIRPVIQRNFSQGGGNLRPASWRALLDAIRALRPEVVERLNGLMELADPGRPTVFPEEYDMEALEKDTVGVALDIAGINRKVLLNWLPSAAPAPFLRGLENYQPIEDSMLLHDMQLFGDWQLWGPTEIGAVEFRQRNQRLTVMNVNRTGAEHVLGVDLIYYHHEYDAYVLVQYKRLRDENGTLVYRPTQDRSYKKEIKNMQKIEDALQHDGDSYRLHYGACYFKLCKPQGLDPSSIELVQGMYLPFDFWQSLVTSESTIGPQGGRIFSYDSVGRHLTNTSFTELIAKGWIGSAGLSSSQLGPYIKAALQGNRSVTLARSAAE
jgi:hypothetical protein